MGIIENIKCDFLLELMEDDLRVPMAPVVIISEAYHEKDINHINFKESVEALKHYKQYMDKGRFKDLEGFKNHKNSK